MHKLDNCKALRIELNSLLFLGNLNRVPGLMIITFNDKSLIIHVSTMSKYLFKSLLLYLYIGTCILFGDGGGAAILGPTEASKCMLMSMDLHSNGRG